jgi:hypothetical protein
MSLLSSFTRSPKSPITGPSVQTDTTVTPIDGRLFATTTTAAISANAIYCLRFRVQKPILVANAKIFFGATVAGNYDLGIYTSDGTTWTLRAHTGDGAAAGASAISTRALLASYLLVPGVDYWAALGGTDATLTILRVGIVSAVGAFNNDMIAKAAVYSSGLPNSFVTPSTTTFCFWQAFTT